MRLQYPRDGALLSSNNLPFAGSLLPNILFEHLCHLIPAVILLAVRRPTESMTQIGGKVMMQNVAQRGSKLLAG